jgi:hypothetical protein
MDKQNIDEVVDRLLATRQNVSKAELRAVVELIHAGGGQVIASYDEDGPPKLGGLIDSLTAKGLTVRVFPYGIPVIDEAFLQIGRGK